MKTPRLLLALLFLAQFGLFWQYAKREIVWAYPGGYDQSAYLTLDTLLYQDILHEGPLSAIRNYLHQIPPTGLMLPLQDSFLHFFLGPGRMSNLLLNFLYFVLLEVAVFTTARWRSGYEAFGWLGCGLLMMQMTAFLSSGGMFDCRIDFIVYSLYGIFLCLLIRSDGMREKRWIVAAGGCAILMVGFRFITFAYLLGMCMTFFTALLGLWMVWRGRWRERAVLGRAMRRTAVLGGVFLVGGGALIARNWRVIHDYYVVGHLTGNEKHLRAIEMGVTNLTGHLTYYFSSLFEEHLGAVFVAAWIALAALGLAGWFFGRSGTLPLPRRFGRTNGRWIIELLLLCASLFAPWFVLTLDESKSPVVAGVLGPPCVLLLISLVAGLTRRWRAGSASGTPVALASTWWSVAAAVTLVLGSANWLNHLARQWQYSSRRPSVEQIGALYDLLGDEAPRRGLTAPRIATDVMYDWLVPSTINVSLFERSGRWLGAHPSLGFSMFAISREEVFSELAKADIALITTFPKEGPYPFYASIRPLGAEINAWCVAHLVRSRTFRIDDGEVTVYFRPNVALEGLSGEWITPAGFRIRVPADIVEKMRVDKQNFLVLEGPENPALLEGLPVASAQLAREDGTSGAGAACPATFALPKTGMYQLRIDLGAQIAVLPAGAGAEVTVHLDGASFYPPDVGINDPRHLVVTKPEVVRFE